MSKILFQKLLQGFKKANKERRLKLAMKYGYSDPDAYKAYLEKMVADSEDVPATNGAKPRIHVIDILDCSGSMGSKIRAAVKGINQNIQSLKDDSTADYTYTLCHFSHAGDIQYSYQGVPVNDVESVSFKNRGMTALYDAIGLTMANAGTGTDKILINIYTDGMENASIRFSRHDIAKLISSDKENKVFTFVGTPTDVANVSQQLEIDKSNTLAYDNTAQGLEKALKSTRSARMSFASSVAAGEDVSRGFYKEVIS